MPATGSMPVEVMNSGVPVQAGTVLAPPPGRGLLRPGPGTELLNDGRTVVASTSGMAVIDHDQAVIYPADIIKGDVFPQLNVSVSGDLVVTGRLQPGAVVRVGGSVLVRGATEGATLEALGSVFLQGTCNNSQVQAGTTRYAYVQLVGRVEAVATSFRQLLTVIDHLHSAPSFRSVDLRANLGPLLRVLFEQKFAAFPGQMAYAIQQLQAYRHYGGPVAELQNIMERCFCAENLLSTTYADVQAAYDQAREVVEMFSATGGHRHDIVIERGAVASTLQASGTIKVPQGDVRRCAVKADTGISVGGRVEGGTLLAGEWITVATVTGGSALEINGPGAITAAAIEPGTLVRVFNTCSTLEAAVTRVQITLEGDRLQFADSQEVAYNV
ncbi:MAG TPA: FapA family protein [Symbiobacteriaceae bacterium]